MNSETRRHPSHGPATHDAGPGRRVGRGTGSAGDTHRGLGPPRLCGEVAREQWAVLTHELAIARAQLSLAERAGAELSLARRVNEEVSRASGLGDLAEAIVDLVVGALDYEGACLLTVPSGGALTPTAHRGLTGEQLRLLIARLVGSAAGTGRAADLFEAVVGQGLRLAIAGQNVVVLPLRASSELVGALACLRPASAGPIGGRDAARLEIVVRPVAAAVKSASLARELRALFVNTVQALAAAVDAKDPYTRGHSQRVSRLCLALGRALGLEEQRVEDLYLAGALHDVGKIAVPERVLLKRGRLDDVEWQDMRLHPAKGAEIVAHVPELTRLLPAIRHHHERYGGSGYPDGLSGPDIPEDARILAVCDAFDAVTSQRTYRAARSAMSALGEIHRHRGSQFDPEVADHFIEHAARSEMFIGIVQRGPNAENRNEDAVEEGGRSSGGE